MMSAVNAPSGDELSEPSPRSGGNASAVLTAVFAVHYGNLVSAARLLVDDRGQAEELVQEAFARTYAAWPRLRTPDDPLPYLRRSVINLARGTLRRRLTIRRAQLPAPGDSSSAEASVIDRIGQRDVIRAVKSLPIRQRECVVLRFGSDCSIAEVAAALKISEGSVKQHLHRALNSLRLALDPEDEE